MGKSLFHRVRGFLIVVFLACWVLPALSEQPGISPPPPQPFSPPDPPNLVAVTFDLNAIAVPEIPGLTREEVARRSLNYLLNFTSTLKKPVKVPQSDIGKTESGKVTLSEFGSSQLVDALNMAKFKQLEQQGVVKNPYACVDDEPNQYRLDFLAASMMAPKVYKAMMGYPDTWQQTARKYGVSENPPGTQVGNNNPNRIVVARGKITTAGGNRVLEFEVRQGRANRFVRRSYDFSSILEQGNEKKFADVAAHPNDFRAQAGEFIIDLDNGFEAYYLAAGEGQNQGIAPGEIVKQVSGFTPKINGTDDSRHHAATIVAPWDCLRCHSGGSQSEGGGFEIAKFLEKKLARGLITKAEFDKAKEHYISGKAFDKQMSTQQDSFVDALKKAEAYVPLKNDRPAPLLPLIATAYEKALDFKQIALELGFKDDNGGTIGAKTATDKLVAALTVARNSPWRKRLELPEKPTAEDLKKFEISRKDFEDLFCDLKTTLIQQEALTPTPRANRQPQPRVAPESEDRDRRPPPPAPPGGSHSGSNIREREVERGGDLESRLKLLEEKAAADAANVRSQLDSSRRGSDR